MTVFRRDVATGTLPRVDSRGGTGFRFSGADTLAMSGDGAFLYVGARFDEALTVLRRNPTTGRRGGACVAPLVAAPAEGLGRLSSPPRAP